ncbi:helix-turn-helix transcriptional regulator [Pseudomonas sp. MYb185]|uniref:helix-turn-helix transcriptional regulator n=1 Tax=Pseudomonas sp. MYb185 TaxID=1848729 RepID=UPI00130480BA|nr:helix-turn-helix transcriptional regulator [Pseudomonas sp. MYb185]
MSFDIPSPKSAMARKHSKFSDLLSKLEGNQEGAAALANARQQIADTYYKDAPTSLKTLRLKAGLSQQALAKAVNTSQPHIANIENGKQNMMLETAALLSKALNVSLDQLFAVWESSRKQA